MIKEEDKIKEFYSDYRNFLELYNKLQCTLEQLQQFREISDSSIDKIVFNNEVAQSLRKIADSIENNSVNFITAQRQTNNLFLTAISNKKIRNNYNLMEQNINKAKLKKYN